MSETAGKCLVLGANGFIGSHLVDSLVEAGYRVRAFDRKSNTKEKFNKSDNVDIFYGDFLNRHDLARATEGVDYVFHFISTTTPATSENDPLIDIETNIKMSVELFQECADKGIKKIIFASSGGSIYGEASSLGATETTLPRPISPYAIGKLTIEHYLRYFAKKYGLESVAYRISNPYGERQALNAKQGVIPIFLQHIAKGQPITVMGEGTMVRDYIYVKDVARLIALSFKAAQRDTYNLGSGQGASINDIIEVMKRITGEEFEIKHKESMATFVEEIALNTDRFRNEFNLQPEVTLEDGISLTWDYIQKQA